MSEELKNINNCMPDQSGEGVLGRGWPPFRPRPLFSSEPDMLVLSREAYANSKAKGFWDNEDPFDPKIVAMKIALMHSELSEGLEGVRKDKQDDHLPHLKMLDCELADTLIRIFDLCGARGIDIDDVIRQKMAYNANREKMHGGKKF